MRDITQITNITGITRKGGSVQTGIPYPSDLLARFDTRAAGSLTIQNSIAAAHALIKGGKMAYADGASVITNTAIMLSNGDVFEFSALSLIDARILFDFGAGKYFTLNLTNTSVRIYLDVTQTKTFTTARSTTVPIKYRITISGMNILLKRLDTNEELTFTFGSEVSLTISGIFKYSSSYFTGYLSGLTKNGQLLYALNDNAVNSVTGVAATATGITYQSVRALTPASTLTALDSGYYKLSTGEKVINPQFALPVGATAYTGGHVHNFIDSFVDFAATTNAIFDRSNTTVYEQAARDSVYYDSGNPYQFHISELLNATVNGYLKAAYKERFYIAIYETYTVKNYIFDIFAYTTQKAGSQVTKIKTYCNDI